MAATQEVGRQPSAGKMALARTGAEHSDGPQEVGQDSLIQETLQTSLMFFTMAGHKLLLSEGHLTEITFG